MIYTFEGASDRLANSVTTPGHILTCAFNDKCRDYLAGCQREGIAFIPLPVEPLGDWHAKAVLQIQKLAWAQARTTGKDEDEAIRHLFQRLAVKGNAALTSLAYCEWRIVNCD